MGRRTTQRQGATTTPAGQAWLPPVGTVPAPRRLPRLLWRHLPPP